MSDALAIVVLVTAAHRTTAATTAMVAAASQTLGVDSRIMLDAVEQIPADEDAALFVDMIGSDAIVEVTWPDEKFGRARVRVFARRRAVWIEREVQFAAGDAEAERGRTVGYAFAAMMPEAMTGPTSAPPLDPAPASAPTTDPEKIPPMASASRGSRADLGVARVQSPATVALDLRGGTLGAARTSMFAVGVAARWLAPRTWMVGAAVDVGRGSLGAFAVSDTRFALSAGARKQLARTLELSMILDLTIARTSVNHDSDARVRWIPGTAVGPELHWALAGPIGLAIRAAVDVVPWPTIVTVGGATVEALTPFRWSVSAAIRVKL